MSIFEIIFALFSHFFLTHFFSLSFLISSKNAFFLFSFSTGTDNGSFDTNTCLETTSPGLYILGNCSDDGTSISELTFADSACSQQTGSYPNKANKCIANSGKPGFTLYTCETKPTPPSPGPSPGSCSSPYPDCVANADQASCDECAKCNWCAGGFYCSNDSCP